MLHSAAGRASAEVVGVMRCVLPGVLPGESACAVCFRVFFHGIVLISAAMSIRHGISTINTKLKMPTNSQKPNARK